MLQTHPIIITRFLHILFFIVCRKIQGKTKLQLLGPNKLCFLQESSGCKLNSKSEFQSGKTGMLSNITIFCLMFFSYSALKFSLDIVMHNYSNAAWWKTCCSHFHRKWGMYIIEFAVFIPTNLTRLRSLGGSITWSALHQRSVLPTLPCVSLNCMRSSLCVQN